MNKKINSSKNNQPRSPYQALLTRQRVCAAANLRLIFHSWWVVFSAAAVLHILFWPQTENITCVLLAWTSCFFTGLAILKSRVTFSHPWSSLMVLMFCLTTSGLPLVLLLLQGDPLVANLEVPVATFFHLLVCQILLLVVHAAYRNFKMLTPMRESFRRRLLRPLGFLTPPSFTQMLGMGLVGLVAATYIYCFLNKELGGGQTVTGSVWNKLFEGLCPLAFTPFLLLVHDAPGAKRNTGVRLGMVFLYFLPILIIAIVNNGRSFAFFGAAIALIYMALMVISGKIRLVIRRSVVIAGIGLLLLITVGSDLAVAMRIARFQREAKSSLELVQETLSLLSTERGRLNQEKALMRAGEDNNEAWYVTNPVFSRLVITHFQDKALAIGLSLSSQDCQLIRQIEIDKLLITLPNPLLKLLGLSINKNEVGMNSTGDWMEYLGGKKSQQEMGGNGAGGFIGDGYAAFGWGYLLPFGITALLLFGFSDSLYGVSVIRTAGGSFYASSFAVVGLVFSYSLSMSLTSESVVGMVSFTIRQPLQMLVLYGVVFWGVGFLVRSFSGSKTNALRPRRTAIEKAKC